MRRKRNNKLVGIYLWKLILIIIIIFAVFISVECFFLIEKTVRKFVSGFSEKYNTSITDSNENTNTIENTTTNDNDKNTRNNNESDNDNQNNIEEPISDVEVLDNEPESPILVCTDESHTHTDICYDDNVTQEERMAIYNLVQEIDAMPTYYTVTSRLRTDIDNYNNTSNSSYYNSYKTYLFDRCEEVEQANAKMIEIISVNGTYSNYITNKDKLEGLLKILRLREAFNVLNSLPLKSDFNSRINDLKNNQNATGMIAYLEEVSGKYNSANQNFVNLNIDSDLYQYIINYDSLINLQNISNNLTQIEESIRVIKDLPKWNNITKQINTYKTDEIQYFNYLNDLSERIEYSNNAFNSINLNSNYYKYVVNYDNYNQLLVVPKILRCANIIKDLPKFEDVKININEYKSNNQVDEIIEYLTNISNNIESQYNLFLAEKLKRDYNTYVINYLNLTNLNNMYLSEIIQFTIQINSLPSYDELKEEINIYKENMDIDGYISYLESALTSNIDEIYDSLENSEKLDSSYYDYIINFENLEKLHDTQLEKIKSLINQIEALANIENIDLSDSVIRNKLILASQNYKELVLENPSSTVFIINIDKLRELEDSMFIIDNNIEITLQYYANIDILNSESNSDDDAALNIIDTTDKKMPENTGNYKNSPNDNAIKTIYLDKSTGKIQTTKEQTELYRTHTMKFDRYFNDFSINNLLRFTAFYDTLDFSYELKEIWVLKNGKEPNSINPDDFIIYEFKENLYLTRDLSAQESKDSVFVYNNAYVRYVYDTKENDDDDTKETIKFPTEFYDYDISTGRVHRAFPPNDPNQYVFMTAGETFSGDSLTSSVLTWASKLSGWDGHLYVYTNEVGINSSDNYNGSGAKFAFGNASTGTNLGKTQTWRDKKNKENSLNKWNSNGYQGCTFGLITGISEDGKIQYASGIQAPNLFNEGDAIGKETYNQGEYSLGFVKIGDTYSLSEVENTVAINLETFTNPSNSEGLHDTIWTNNFWPMDSAPSFGTDTHDVKFGGTETAASDAIHQIRYGPKKENDKISLPESDDGMYHNSYFGMHFELKFNLSKDYTGPLEYYFFGDDDMWVFLDNTLIIDIGGVHSATGSYANLWDYLNKGDEGEHTLKFFFTERGASGSTCWMRFTLPEVGTKKVNPSVGNLRIEKEVIGIDTAEEFQFTTTLFNKETNNPLKEYYYYDKYDSNGVLIKENGLFKSGDSFLIKSGEYIIIKSLPSGTKYLVEEETDEKYIAFSQNSSGSISEGGTADVNFTNFYNYKTAKVIKEWNDNNDYAQVRPEKIEVKLCAKTEDGEDCEVYIKENAKHVNFTATLKDVSNWIYEWKKLPKYKVKYNTDGTADMKEIQYTVKEIYTDELSENYYKLSSSTENNVTTITNYKYRELTVTKLDIDNPDIKLGGAEFKLQKLKKVNDVWEIDTDFEPISATTSIDDDDLGQATFSGLEIGKYLLVEEESPDGYNLNTKMEEIEVTEDTPQTIEIEFVDKRIIILPFTGGSGINLFIISGLSLIILTILKLRKVRIINTQNLRPKRRKRKQRK